MAVILTGTDPDNASSGIGSAVAGYRQALIVRGLFGGLIPTFKSGQFSGKWWPWLKAIPVLFQTIRGLKKQGTTVVVFGHAGPHISMARESLILLWARLCGARTMLQLHSAHVDRYLNRTITRWLMRAAFMPVERVAVLSPWWLRRLSESGFYGAVVIPNALPEDLESVAHRKQGHEGSKASTRQAERQLNVLAMARLTRGKGVHIAIEALKYLPTHFVLHIAGDGPERTKLGELAQSLGVAERVKFLGWVSDQEKHRVMDAADVFCLPSRADSFGMVFVEAMAHGKPVITVSSRAISEVVVSGETGLIVDADDFESPVRRSERRWDGYTTEIWAKAIAKAIEDMEQLSVRTHMGAAGVEWVLTKFGADVIGKKIEEVAYEIVTEST